MGVEIISRNSIQGSPGYNDNKVPTNDKRQTSTVDGNSLPPVVNTDVTGNEIAPSSGQLYEGAPRSNTQLQFRVNETTGNTVITVRNAESGAFVRQIPTREMLAIAQYIAESAPILNRGSFVDDSK